MGRILLGVSDDQPTPPPPEQPPAPHMPPPPTGQPVGMGEPAAPTPDNPIAVAGLVVSLMALILSIVVIGGLVAILGFVLSFIGLRRSRTIGRGRGAALGGIALAGLSLLFSTVAVGFIVAAINGGEERVIDGIVTTSSNTEFPPQDDLESVECDASGNLGLAIVTLENRSGGQSLYSVTVEWDTEAGVVETGTLRSEFLAAGESQTMRLFDRSGNGVADTCRVARIERSGLGLLPG